MVDVLIVIIAVVSLSVAGFGLVLAAMNRTVGVSLLVGLGLIEIVLLVQAVVAIVKMVGGQRPDELAVFLAYLVGALCLPPAGAYLGLGERSRWGPVAVAVACAVVPVMALRLQQIWQPLNA
jgi:hypothetical protein